MKPSSAKTALSYLVTQQRPAFLWGAPGIGKSDLVAQVAQANGMQLIDVRLNLLDPVDLKGFPVPDMTEKLMNWLPANFLPPMQVKGKGGKMVPNPGKYLLFLDEMNAALPAMQAAAYQLILNRRIGDYVLPNGASIMAAGNREGDRSVTNRMPAALANRLVHIDFEANLDDWCTWAVDNDISTDLIAFMRFRPSMLHMFDPAANAKAFPTPRSWAFVDQIYKSGMTPDIEFELIKGTVGEGAGSEFSAFTRTLKDLPSIDKIMLNPDKVPVPENPAVLYALSTALGAKATKDCFDRLMIYITRMPTEFQVVSVRDAVKRDDKVCDTKSFTAWSIANASVLT